MTAEPVVPASDEVPRDRDGRGRFQRGHSIPGPGRPRGTDLRQLAQAKSIEHGLDLDQALWEVLQTLLAAAKGGDVAAAKLLLDRLADPGDLTLRSVVLSVCTGVPPPALEEATDE